MWVGVKKKKTSLRLIKEGLLVLAGLRPVAPQVSQGGKIASLAQRETTPEPQCEKLINDIFKHETKQNLEKNTVASSNTKNMGKTKQTLSVGGAPSTNYKQFNLFEESIDKRNVLLSKSREDFLFETLNEIKVCREDASDLIISQYIYTFINKIFKKVVKFKRDINLIDGKTK